MKLFKLTLHVWRQKDANDKGKMKIYEVDGINPHMSFLEMLDVLNEKLIEKNEDPLAYDHDCREGICGACGLVINGRAHGPMDRTTTCQLHMRHFKDGDHIFIEPLRARAFPIIKDLVVDRTALDRIIQSAGFVSVNTGQAPEAGAILVPKEESDLSMDAAACIGCGSCVASCKNASAMLFVGAKVSHLAYLPQGRVERKQRVRKMVKTMDKEGFGACTNFYECEAVCPKGVKKRFIAVLNAEKIRASLA